VRIILVNMPWAALEVPSLALGALRRTAADAAPGARLEVRYANLEFADWAVSHLPFTIADYDHVAQETYFLGAGDWVFSSALHDDPTWREREFRQLRGMVLSAERMTQLVALHRLAPRFVTELAGSIVSAGPDVVGFTSTFQQNVAALAAARQIKRLAPQVVTVFGGANCDGRQGEALHRGFPFVDLVCRGEGERVFAELLTVLADRGGTTDPAPRYAAVAGLCWRTAEGDPVVNPLPRAPLPPDEIGVPDYDDFFAQLAASKVGADVEPKLVVEGARGCWWGARHHCTFCGLNGSSMAFRSKPPDRFYREVLDLVERHRVLDVFVVDNILDMGYLTSCLPKLADAGYDLRLQFEIKSNLRYDQLAVLRQAGASTVQPGIENFSSRVLELMRKGVHGCHNARILRDAEALGLSVAWNYLYGFPGETDRDYTDILDQLPALHHLPPPLSSGRVVIERFSPYFDDLSLGFPDPRPDPQYAVTYALPPDLLHGLAYLFRAALRGIGARTADRVDAAVADWRRHYPRSRLSFVDHGDSVTLVSRRPGFDWSVHRLVEPAEVTLFRALDQPRTATSLRRLVAAASGPVAAIATVDVDAAAAIDVDAAVDVDQVLSRWRALGIIFAESDRFIQVAVPAGNQDLFHLRAPGPGRDEH
jgi:ribosomal peptide maturation radical SAM protein 1